MPIFFDYMLPLYIHALTGRIFKILPLKENAEAGENVYLSAYLDGELTSAEAADLRLQQLHAAAGGQRRDGDPQMRRRRKGLPADAAGGTENG